MVNSNKTKILVLSIGTPGKGDDELGHLFIDKLQTVINNDIDSYNHIDFHKALHLNIEDSELISQFDEVYIVDSCVSNEVKSFEIIEVSEQYPIHFTSHIIQAEQIKYLSKNLFHASPKIFKIQIKGYSFELGEQVTNMALNNLNSALNEFLKRIKKIPDINNFEG